MKIGKRGTLIIYFAILISVVLIFHQAIYQPKKKEVERIQKEIRALEANLENINRILPTLPAMEREILKEQAKWGLFTARSPAGNQLAKIVRQLALESSRWHLNLVSIKPFEELELDSGRGEKSAARPKKVILRIQIRSPYPAFAAFLQALENTPSAWTIVEDFEISKKEEDEMGLNLDILVKISSYAA